MYPELFLTKIAPKIEEKTVKTLVKKSKFRRFLAFLGGGGVQIQSGQDLPPSDQKSPKK